MQLGSELAKFPVVVIVKVGGIRGLGAMLAAPSATVMVHKCDSKKYTNVIQKRNKKLLSRTWSEHMHVFDRGSP
jgi:hypothetical protein